jgi:hypothetical protein
MRLKVFNSYTEKDEEIDVCPLIKAFASVVPTKVGERKYEGWKGNLPFYLFKCKKHGWIIDYPHGYDFILRCPLCEGDGK